MAVGPPKREHTPPNPLSHAPYKGCQARGCGFSGSGERAPSCGSVAAENRGATPFYPRARGQGGLWVRENGRRRSPRPPLELDRQAAPDHKKGPPFRGGPGDTET